MTTTICRLTVAAARTDSTVCTITVSSLCAGMSTVTSGGGSEMTVWSGRSFSIRASTPITMARPLTRQIPTMKMVAKPTRNQRYRLKMKPSARASKRSCGESGSIMDARGFAQQVGDGNKLVALRAQSVNYLGQGRDGLAAVAAAIVEKNNVAVGRPGLQRRRQFPRRGPACRRAASNRADRFSGPR